MTIKSGLQKPYLYRSKAYKRNDTATIEVDRLELSRLIFEFKEGDINSFMRDFVDDYRLDLEKNGIKLETDIPIDEVIVRMDYEKISRVFSNLIDNAVKYRSEDNPTVQCAVTAVCM